MVVPTCVRHLTSTAARRAAAPEGVFILGSARTPTGAFNGGLAKATAPQLAGTAIKAAVQRASIPADRVQEAFIGNVVQASVGQAPARQAVLAAGLPSTTEATTINKVCASGLKSVTLTAAQLALGQRDLMIAGGMESMSNAPFYIQRGATSGFGHGQLSDSLVLDGLFDVYNKVMMGVCAEKTAADHQISRQAQDDYALASYRRANQAWDRGAFDKEIAPVTISDKRKGDRIVDRDEGLDNVEETKIRSLKPVFQKDGTVTAANASTLADGASALVLANESTARSYTPVARIVASADHAVAPIDFGIAPTGAIQTALQRAGLTKDDIALYEINEAFAVVAVANTQLLDLDPAKVNVNGGGVSLGHPIGSSGSRILVTLVHALKPGEYGVAAVCNGGGGASAVVVQAL